MTYDEYLTALHSDPVVRKIQQRMEKKRGAWKGGLKDCHCGNNPPHAHLTGVGMTAKDVREFEQAAAPYREAYRQSREK